MRQTIERHTIRIDHRISHQERIDIFTEIIKKDPKKFAKDLLYLEQRSKDLDAQLIGINLLVGKGYTADFSQRHNLKDLILRCASPFMPLLKLNNSRVEFKNLDNIEIQTDFRLFNCAMYHFFDNAQKYIKPDANIIISINFEEKELSFIMKSRAIEKTEKESIFNEGFTGSHSGGQKGEGLGLYIFSLVLNELDAITYVDFNENTRFGRDDIIYQENIFYIKFLKETLYKI
jgi:signal transduction histidine kinase